MLETQCLMIYGIGIKRRCFMETLRPSKYSRFKNQLVVTLQLTNGWLRCKQHKMVIKWPHNKHFLSQKTLFLHVELSRCYHILHLSDLYITWNHPVASSHLTKCLSRMGSNNWFRLSGNNKESAKLGFWAVHTPLFQFYTCCSMDHVRLRFLMTSNEIIIQKRSSRPSRHRRRALVVIRVVRKDLHCWMVVLERRQANLVLLKGTMARVVAR